MSPVHTSIASCGAEQPDDTTRRMAIGLFDSGVGGLTVLDALRQCLPREDFLYLGDTARLPYGTKSPETITRYALQAARQLVDRNIKLLVVACNTVSAVALPALEAAFGHIPVIGVVRPGALAACRASQSGSIAVIATASTTRGGAYVRAIRTLRPEARVTSLATPLLVPMAEEGWFDGPLVEGIIARYLDPLMRKSRCGDVRHNQDTLCPPRASDVLPDCVCERALPVPDLSASHALAAPASATVPGRLCADPAVGQHIPSCAGVDAPVRGTAHAASGADDAPDCLVLGCTHFPMLLPAIRQVVGPEMVLVDSAATTALAVRDRLRAEQLDSPNAGGGVHFLTTDDVSRFAATGSLFLRVPITQDDVELVDL